MPSNTVVSAVDNNIYAVKVDVSLLKIYGNSSHCTAGVLLSTCFLTLPFFLFWKEAVEEVSGLGIPIS